MLVFTFNEGRQLWIVEQMLCLHIQVDAKEKEGAEKEASAEKAETAEPEIKKESDSAESAEAAKKSDDEPKAETPKDRVIKDGQLQVRQLLPFGGIWDPFDLKLTSQHIFIFSYISLKNHSRWLSNIAVVKLLERKLNLFVKFELTWYFIL